MTIRVRVDATGWHLFVGPTDVGAAHTGIAPSPTTALSMLSSWGCHSTDATDALDATGINWRPMHDAELARQRGEQA